MIDENNFRALLSISEHQNMVNQIEVLKKFFFGKTTIAAAPAKKQVILAKYL